MTHVGFLLGTCSNRTEIIVYAWIRYCPGCRQDMRATYKGDASTGEIRQNAAGLNKGIYIVISLPSLFYKHSQINHPVQLGVQRQASLVSVSRKKWGLKREVLH